jgi:hypothetical protein
MPISSKCTKGYQKLKFPKSFASNYSILAARHNVYTPKHASCFKRTIFDVIKTFVIL